MKTLLIDNYDSFTYNLYQYIGELGGNPIVKKNDEVNREAVEKLSPTHIVLSPGPGTPEKDSDFGICQEVILTLGKHIPLLGVCLGHQGIVYAFGGKIIPAPEVRHGKTSAIQHDGKTIFTGIANPFTAMRYHSLLADRTTLPDCLEISAVTEDELIMGVRHKTYPIEGIQFHPESIGTHEGKKILKNFLSLL
ncbi:MAG: Para-aminobenzoate/anthranilate synthase glutamine amidotransferasecomponent II [uncultured bacterium]|nr:MAG: Para-aminobenzoate/anthranilate synthase glutamine amidotransferasecomponent II [uncultured bacterium]